MIECTTSNFRKISNSYTQHTDSHVRHVFVGSFLLPFFWRAEGSASLRNAVSLRVCEDRVVN